VAVKLNRGQARARPALMLPFGDYGLDIEGRAHAANAA